MATAFADVPLSEAQIEQVAARVVDVLIDRLRSRARAEHDGAVEDASPPSAAPLN